MKTRRTFIKSIVLAAAAPPLLVAAVGPRVQYDYHLAIDGKNYYRILPKTPLRFDGRKPIWLTQRKGNCWFCFKYDGTCLTRSGQWVDAPPQLEMGHVFMGLAPASNFS